MWATLLSELINNARFILRTHGKLTPRMSWWFSLAIAFTVAAFRMTGVLVAMLWVFQGGLSGLPLIINVGAITIYMIYMIYMLTVVARELGRTNLLVLDMTCPAAFVVAEKWRVEVLGIASGFGLVCAEISSILLYEAAGNRESSETELQSIAWVTLQAIVTGLLGAYLVGGYSRSTRGKEAETTGKPPRLFVLGGLISVAAVLQFSPTMAKSVDKTAFLACTALSFPLVGAFGQIGCFYAGIGLAAAERCSFSFLESPTLTSPVTTTEKGVVAMDPPSAKGRSKNKKTARRGVRHSEPPKLTAESIVPLPLIAAALSGVLFVSLVTAYLAGYLDLQHAGTLSLILYGFIRCDVEPRRNDIEPAMVRLLGCPPLPVVPLLYLATGLGYSAHRTLLSSLSSSTSLSLSSALTHDMILVVSACFIHMTVSTLSLPRAGKRSSIGAAAEATTVGLELGTATPTTPPHRKGKGKLITVVASLALCLLIGTAIYLDCMPKQHVSLEKAKTALKPNHALWDTIASWQFGTVSAIIAVLPVVMAQLLG